MKFCNLSSVSCPHIRPSLSSPAISAFPFKRLFLKPRAISSAFLSFHCSAHVCSRFLVTICMVGLHHAVTHAGTPLDIGDVVLRRHLASEIELHWSAAACSRRSRESLFPYSKNTLQVHNRNAKLGGLPERHLAHQSWPPVVADSSSSLSLLASLISLHQMWI